jgi:hypothetical protein
VEKQAGLHAASDTCQPMEEFTVHLRRIGRGMYSFRNYRIYKDGDAMILCPWSLYRSPHLQEPLKRFPTLREARAHLTRIADELP